MYNFKVGDRVVVKKNVIFSQGVKVGQIGTIIGLYKFEINLEFVDSNNHTFYQTTRFSNNDIRSLTKLDKILYDTKV